MTPSARRELAERLVQAKLSITRACQITGLSRAAAKGIAVRYIQPGKPNQNAFIERFNRTYRTKVLNAHLFANLQQVQSIIDSWLSDYNEYRPHDSLGGVAPMQFMPRITNAPTVYRSLST